MSVAKETSILQKVKAGDVRVGQQVKFPTKKTWWKVVEKRRNRTVVQKGRSVQFLSFGWELLQEPFDNLETSNA